MAEVTVICRNCRESPSGYCATHADVQVVRLLGDDAVVVRPDPDRRSVSRAWECPRCGAVYAPHVGECWRCNAGKLPGGVT